MKIKEFSIINFAFPNEIKREIFIHALDETIRPSKAYLTWTVSPEIVHKINEFQV